MAGSADLSIEMAGLRFKSPILVASSECGSNISVLSYLTDRKIGGIVTKTFTSAPGSRIRVRPYQFPLNKFGKAYAEGGCLYSLAAPHVEDSQKVQTHVSQMAAHCRDRSIVLIVSFFEDPQNVDLWINQAKLFEKEGADMLELNFSSPSAAGVFSKSFQAAGNIIARVKEKTAIPVGLKLSPTLEPLETFISTCVDNGLDFITAHNAPGGIVIDVDNEVPFGAPAIGGYVMGRVFLPYSLGRVVRIRQMAEIPVIGVGGICEARDALQYLLCGCPLVGIGSAMYFEGPQILDTIHDGICDWMQTKGYESIGEFKGTALRRIKNPGILKSEEKYPYTTPPDCPYVPTINAELCTLCGTCETNCICRVFMFDERQSKICINENKCWSCGFCVGVCPAGAIELRDRRNQDRIIWSNQGVTKSFPI